MTRNYCLPKCAIDLSPIVLYYMHINLVKCLRNLRISMLALSNLEMRSRLPAHTARTHTSLIILTTTTTKPAKKAVSTNDVYCDVNPSILICEIDAMLIITQSFILARIHHTFATAFCAKHTHTRSFNLNINSINHNESEFVRSSRDNHCRFWDRNFCGL